jgi:hypothetical protein
LTRVNLYAIINVSNEREVKKMKKVIENAQYVVLVLLIVGQCTIGPWYLLGQGVYLIANLISVVRTFYLKRPAADKVKDCACTAITTGLILIAIL